MTRPDKKSWQKRTESTSQSISNWEQEELPDETFVTFLEPSNSSIRYFMYLRNIFNGRILDTKVPSCIKVSDIQILTGCKNNDEVQLFKRDKSRCFLRASIKVGKLNFPDRAYFEYKATTSTFLDIRNLTIT